MYKEHNRKQFLLLLLSLVALISLASLVILLDEPHPTANIIAQGGEITNISLNQSVSTTKWSLVYGVFDEPTGVSSVLLTPGITLKKNMSSYGYDSSFVVIAHTGLFNQSNMLPAPQSLIDTYLGVGPASVESGTNTFNKLYNISIGNVTLELYGTQTISSSGTYVTAALLSQGSLAFVTTTQNGTAFDASPAFYQFFLPVNGVQNYTFEVISALTCPTSYSFAGVLANDNESVVLNWTDFPEVVAYELFETDGMNATNYIEFSTPLFNTTATTHTQNPISTNRYYSLQTYLPAYRCDAPNIVGMHRVELTPSANLISFPFDFVNNTVAERIRPILTSFNSLNRYDNAAETYDFYIQFAGSIFKNFDTVSVGEGYWLTINETVNLTMVGTVRHDVIIPLYNRSNLIGFPLVEGNNTVAYSLRSLDGNYSTLNAYDNAAKLYKFYIIFGGSVFSNFNTIDPTLGYWLLANETETLVLP